MSEQSQSSEDLQRMIFLPSDLQQWRIRLWLLILAAAVLTAAWMHAARLTVDASSTLTTALSCMGLELLASFYSMWRPEPRFAASLSGLAQIIAFSACAAVLSYAVAATGGPFWDENFQTLDQSLGLDWLAYLNIFNDHPQISFVLSEAYQSLMPQMIFLIIALGLGGHVHAIPEFVLAFVIAGLITVLLSGLMPAEAMFAHLDLKPDDFSELKPAAAYVHVAPLSGLRNGTLRSVSLDHLEGIITFPSFHAVLGVMFIRYFWINRITRWPSLALNAMLIAATPIDGGHYFVDVGAGAVIAIFAIATASRVGRSSRNPNETQIPDWFVLCGQGQCSHPPIAISASARPKPKSLAS